MPRPQDIQDLLDHIATVQGVHNITETPATNSVPATPVDRSTIDDNWLSGTFPRLDVNGLLPVGTMPVEVPIMVNGKIPNALLPDTISGKTFQSSGTSTNSKYLLSDGTDIFTTLKAMIPPPGAPLPNNSGGVGTFQFTPGGVVPGTSSTRWMCWYYRRPEEYSSGGETQYVSSRGGCGIYNGGTQVDYGNSGGGASGGQLYMYCWRIS